MIVRGKGLRAAGLHSLGKEEKPYESRTSTRTTTFAEDETEIIRKKKVARMWVSG